MDLKSFLNNSYTAYHAVKNSKSILDAHGFEPLKLNEKWRLETGKKYYVEKNGSSIIAFAIGESFAFNIAESHTDSPCLHVKGNELIPSKEGARLNVEKYGGGILYSFLDTPLKIAGRVIASSNGKLEAEVVESDCYVTIPSLAIHHNPSVNDSFSASVQKDMLPLVGEATNVYSLVSKNDVVDADLYVVPALNAYESGANGEYLCSPRIDNLTSVYSSLLAICDCSPKNIALVGCFDNEEIGNTTKQGANSAFLDNVLKKITSGLGKTEDDFISACENGFVLSIDNAHAMHPSFPEKSDVAQRVYLNEGIVIKHHVNYSTDGTSSAIVKTILDKADVPYQDYYNHSDLRCGGTMGLTTASRLSINACDIGLAQLAMHSGVETIGSKDLDRMTACVNAFLNCKINNLSDAWIVE